MNKFGIVACGHEQTADAAMEVLRAGGTAVDAAIAGFFAACVAEPVLASTGGGGFAMIRANGQKPMLLDFFTQTPGSRRPVDQLDFESVMVDFGSALQEFHVGWGSVATPGAVRGLFEMHRRFGTLPMRELAAPALELIRSGASVSALQAEILGVVEPIYVGRESARRMFASQREPGRVVREGESVRWFGLDDFLDTLCREGEDLFYRGEISQNIHSLCKTRGGSITRDDLADYQAIWRDPLQVRYRDARVFLNPPPSAGGSLILFALTLLAGQNSPDDDLSYYLHLAEALRLTNEARLKSTGSRPWPELEKLLGESFVAEFSDQLTNTVKSWRGTTHLSVADSAGNSVGVTVSNGEGCGEVIPETGVMLNNMLGEEDLNPQGFHRWPLNERMSSMMCPTIVETGDAVVTLGSGGSNRIRSALLQTILQLIDRELPLESAVLCPRLHLEGDTLNIEGGLEEVILNALTSRFPEQNRFDGRSFFFGGVHSVSVSPAGVSGAGDPRRAGVCISA